MGPASDHRVVVIDNDPLTRMGMRALLTKAEPARLLDDLVDMPTALARLPVLRPDVALVEATLAAEEDGACVHAILRSVPTVRIIAFGTGSREEEIFRVLEAGAAGYLLRSAAERELSRAIRSVEAGDRYIPPEVEVKLRRRQMRRELTPRETDVLRLLARARSNAAIAAALGITLGTAKLHVKSIMAKLGVEDRAEAALVAIERGFARLA
jgi:DNA-binding NarL/FixJ family response regulator